MSDPVQRYFEHAGALAPRVRLRMVGRIRLGVWLPYRGTWEGDGRSFAWRATTGPLRVVDRFADGRGRMEVRLGRVPLVRAGGSDVARSGAGRAAVEAAVWAPGALVPERGVTWRAESENFIVAAWDVPPERPRVRLLIDDRGAIRTATVERWRSPRAGYLPMGGEVHAERRFGELTLASRLTVGWGFGTPRYAPFFEAEIVAAEPAP